MTEAERGWSGAEVRRVEVIYENGRTESMVFKEAALKERMAMKTLTDQGHRNTPAAFSQDTETDEPRWMAIEDVGSLKSPPPGTDWSPKIAQALSGIHARNLQRGSEMPWLPHADPHYWKDYIVTQVSVDHFEALMEQNPEFDAEFGAYLPSLARKSRRICAGYGGLVRGEGKPDSHAWRFADGGWFPCALLSRETLFYRFRFLLLCAVLY